MDRRKHLKIKLKTLAAEARFIRHEEQKLNCKPSPHWDCSRNQAERYELHVHRTFHVRREARATLLAYCFLRGRSYGQVEHAAKTKPNWDRVEAMVKKYGRGRLDEFKKWKPD